MNHPSTAASQLAPAKRQAESAPTPYPHQLAELDFLTRHERALLLSQTGTGKTI